MSICPNIICQFDIVLIVNGMIGTFYVWALFLILLMHKDFEMDFVQYIRINLKRDFFKSRLQFSVVYLAVNRVNIKPEKHRKNQVQSNFS